ncbi:hypothetical protein H257_14079 [Aphanomyces astaci]|uniref:Large ribosomal subunit protein mL49 n=1 Tax=Aphanomyces astaci TaxID=112090 RepID=W4FTW9_APHAT|nr:hypothetical protein H257_14079 [Aphanomyces astaci]ETV70401.1 hypothetical protein H257_14079 [Aphanomyces astaci]RHY05933.1 hypothetical protein DYB36_009142 [Aphanomyces astaci]RHY26243.1 hypothetical protein DYB25_003856 [Aphanomyces astaci]RHY46233.1 hypothetical protein DYB34_010680 [Aphanomyces astaci]RHY60595.1 hypothetical protein DYB38_001130 [Aphanomyces astaci]|eukprot:XP_009840113.1 hypothetical protein H257_14079 [Aphanomyces astaci]
MFTSVRSFVVGFAAPLRVASNRQINRKLKHPATLRKIARKEAENPVELVLPPLKFQPTYVPEKVSFNGWSPAREEGPLEGIPFTVKRTATGLQLPVYRDYRNGRTRIITIVRRYHGDEAELQNELSIVCQGKTVVSRPGRLEVVGDYSAEIKQYFTGLGF